MNSPRPELADQAPKWVAGRSHEQGSRNRRIRLAGAAGRTSSTGRLPRRSGSDPTNVVTEIDTTRTEGFPPL